MSDGGATVTVTVPASYVDSIPDSVIEDAGEQYDEGDCFEFRDYEVADGTNSITEYLDAHRIPYDVRSEGSYERGPYTRYVRYAADGTRQEREIDDAEEEVVKQLDPVLKAIVVDPAKGTQMLVEFIDEHSPLQPPIETLNP